MTTGPDEEQTPPQAAATAPRSFPTPTRWLRRRRPVTQPTPTDADAQALPARTSLLYRNPVQIGFFLVLGGMLAYGLVMALVQLQSVVVLCLLSFLLALGLNPPVEWLYRRGMARGLAVLVVALVVVGVIALGLWAVLPVVSDQVNRLILDAPRYLADLRENPQIAELDARFGIINRAIEFLTSGALLTTFFGGILGASRVVANLLFSSIITLVLTLYFLATLPTIKEVLYNLAPASRRPRARYLANEMFHRIGGYVTGLFLVVTCAATVAFIFLNIVGLGTYSLALAVVVGTFAFVPLVGSTISMIIVSIVAFSISPTAGLITLIFFLCYQQFDTYVIQPRIFAKSVNVPGVIVVLAALSGGTLLGIIGAILAVPTAAALLLLYRETLRPHLDRT